MKRQPLRRWLSFLLIFALLSGISANAVSVNKNITDSRGLWKEIRALCAGQAGKRAPVSERDYAALSKDVYALAASSGTVRPGTLSANGDFISWVDRETGMPCCFSPFHEAEKNAAEAKRMTQGVSSALSTSVPRSSEAGIDYSINSPQSLNVGLLQPDWESGTEYYDPIFRRFSPYYVQQANLLASKTGGSVIRYSMENVTPDSIAYTLQNCGTVFLNGHCGTDYRNGTDRTTYANSCFIQLHSGSDEISDVQALLNPEDYSTPHSGFNGVYYDAYFSDGDYLINGTVIANHMTGSAPHSLVYLGCCMGMTTDGILAPLHEKGVETVVGFSETVSTKGDSEFLLSISSELADGKSAAEAVACAKRDVGEYDPNLRTHSCYLVVSSSDDVYPGQGHTSTSQQVVSAWRLSTREVRFFTPSDISAIPSKYVPSGMAFLLPEAADSDEYEFAGWSETPITETANPPVLLHPNEPFSPTGSVTLYAVYRKPGPTTGGYEKVSSEPDYWNGKYLIVCEEYGYVFNASAGDTAETLNTQNNYLTGVQTVNGIIASTAETENAAVNISRIPGTSYYSIKLPCNKYLGRNDTSAGMNVSGTSAFANRLEFISGDSSVIISSTTGDSPCRFAYNAGTGKNRFSYYNPNGSGLHSVCLYKKSANSSAFFYSTSPDTACKHIRCTAIVTPPNCTGNGSTTQVCADCGFRWSTAGSPALGHFFDSGTVVAPEAGNFGYTTYTCRRSGCCYSYQTDFTGLEYLISFSILGDIRMTETVSSYDGTKLPEPASVPTGYSFSGWSKAPLSSESVTAELEEDFFYPAADTTLYAVFARTEDGMTYYRTNVPEELTICSAALILNGKIDVVFHARVPDGFTNPEMTFTGPSGSCTVSAASVTGNDCSFLYTGINPQCIGDSICATLHAEKGGTEYSAAIENYSVRRYCVSKLSDSSISSELRRLLSDLLAYGAAAQYYTNYKTSAPVDDGDDIANPLFSLYSPLTGLRARFTGTAEPSVYWLGAGLTLSNSTAMTFRFHADATDGLSVTVSLNGKTEVFTEFRSTPDTANTYEVLFEGISAAEYADEASARFERNGSPFGSTVWYSVNDYVCARQNDSDSYLADFVKALYNFGRSAKAYTEAER